MNTKAQMPAEFRKADASGCTMERLSEMFGVSKRIVQRWRRETRPIPPGPEYRTSGRTHGRR